MGENPTDNQGTTSNPSIDIGDYNPKKAGLNFLLSQPAIVVILLSALVGGGVGVYKYVGEQHSRFSDDLKKTLESSEKQVKSLTDANEKQVNRVVDSAERQTKTVSESYEKINTNMRELVRELRANSLQFIPKGN